VVFAWQAFFVTPPPPPADPAAVEGQAGTVPAATADGGTAPSGAVAAVEQSRGEALATAPRVTIETEALSGSIALTGARLDDLHLSRYRETQEPDADTVILLNPAGGPAPYFVDYGWRRTVDSDPGPLPSPATAWVVESGDRLTIATPVVLRWDNGQGLIFRRKFEIDDRYMFTVTQSVENTTGDTVALAPYGAIARRGEPADAVGFYILHEGAVGVFDGELVERDYDDIRDYPVSAAERGPAEITRIAESGWLGFTDKYWITSLMPQPGQTFDSVYRMPMVGGVEEFRAEMRTDRLRGRSRYRRFPQGDRLGLVLFPDQADLPASGLGQRPARQHGLRDHRADPAGQGLPVPAGLQILRFDVEDENAAARDGEDQGACRRRQAEDAAGDDGPLQEGEGQPRRGLPADPVADPDLLLAVQGAVRHHRDAPRAVRRLDP
jgi:YidC/Oxa1 family membrane protein insertase